MKRMLMLALLAIPLMGSLSGCVVYEGGYHHHPYWYYR